MVARERVDTFGQRLGGRTIENIRMHTNDCPDLSMEAAHIDRDLANTETYVLRMNRPMTGKTSMLLTSVKPKTSKLPATIEEAVAELNDLPKLRFAGGWPFTRSI